MKRFIHLCQNWLAQTVIKFINNHYGKWQLDPRFPESKHTVQLVNPAWVVGTSLLYKQGPCATISGLDESVCGLNKRLKQ